MSSSANSNRHRFDPAIAWMYVALVIIGLLNIYSASVDVNKLYKFAENGTALRQVMWITGAFLIIITLAFSNRNLISYFAYGFYGITIFLNIAVLFVGREVAGAKSWFGFGGVGIQPSEFAKVGVALALAKFLGSYDVEFKGWKNVGKSIGIFLAPVIIILAQNDTGSALVFLSFFLVLYRVGMPGYYLLAALWLGIIAITCIILSAKLIPLYYLIIALVIIASATIYFLQKSRTAIYLTIVLFAVSSGFTYAIGHFYNGLLKQYQRDRIEVVLGLKEDKRKTGYNLRQSKIAIGAGGVSGRGYLGGTQTKMGFVPEQHTDFIFCTIGEEWGFLGVTALFALYIGLLIRIVNVAEKQQDPFNRIYGYGVACVLFTHFTVNIGMTIGFIPVIGIPLPFISFGGSSLWAFTLLLFIFLKIDDRFSK